MLNSSSPPLEVVPRYVPHPVVPTMTDEEYYRVVYGELEWHSRVGDPLEGRTWGVSARLMVWDKQEGWPDSFFIEVRGPITSHGVTPDESMSDSTHPHHIQVGPLTHRQKMRLALRLSQRNGRFTLRVSKWAPEGHFQTGYLVSGGSLALLLDSTFRQFGLTPPLQGWHISF